MHPNLYAYPFEYNWAQDRVDGILDNKYNSTYTGKGVNVFIVDTGCDTTHTEFDTTGREVKNIASFTNKGTNQELDSDNDVLKHGTYVAASASGRTVSTAKDANLYCIKVFDDDSGFAPVSDIIAALNFVVDWRRENGGDKAMVVINLSLGYICQFNGCLHDPLVAEVNRVAALGIVMVTAACNNGEKDPPVSPASAKDCLTVGATDQADKVAPYSNYGIYVDYWAPGSNVKSACPRGECIVPNQYLTYTGTSVATSNVAGLVALLLERITPTEIQMNSLAAVNMVKETIKCESQQNVILGQNGGSVNDLVKVTVPSAYVECGNTFVSPIPSFAPTQGAGDDDSSNSNIPSCQDGFKLSSIWSAAGYTKKCTACSPGRYLSSDSLNCLECTAGKYAILGSSFCRNCSAGHYSSENAGKCSICPAGRYSGEGSSNCTQCAPSEYSYPGSSSCSGCSAN